MTQAPGSPGTPPTATFHARVAGVGLVTTLVVLIAAFLTFTLQPWAVAHTQSHKIYQALSPLPASTPAPAILTTAHYTHQSVIPPLSPRCGASPPPHTNQSRHNPSD